MAGPPSAPAYTCSGGDWTGDPSTSTFIDIPEGTYASITVTGVCDVHDASITVLGNVDVAAGAVLDAQTAPSTITVGRNVTAAVGSVLGLGCQPDTAFHFRHPCAAEPDGSTDITINGNLTATGADTVLLNGITVNGNVTLSGGGGDIPWSIKWNEIGGNLTISDVTADWLGVLFNEVGRNATLTNITATDPEDETPTIFVVQNTIAWNLNCMGLGPALSAGFFPGEPLNTVGRNATGQCADLAV